MEKATEKMKELTAEAAQAAVDEVFAAMEQELPAVTVDELEDMNMETLTTEEPGAAKVFKITDDSLADWAVRKIADERAELARLKELADEQIARIMEKVTEAEKRCENNTSFMTSKLAEYFETVPHKETKTKHSYRLLSGALVKKIGGVTMKQDDEKLLEYFKSSGNDDMIQIVEKPKWGEFKKRLEIVGGQIVDTDTGEIVEGVEIVTKADTFVVEI
jgi:hypothetical protein